MERMELLQLPDDVLIMVLQRLGVDDVLSCRLVCKRLGGLTLVGDVWRHRSLVDSDRGVSVVLRQVRCLKELTVTRRIQPLLTTRCAIERLILEPEWEYEKKGKRTFSAGEYALVLRNQEQLGRLRHVLLGYLQDQNGAEKLVEALVACSGLESLSVDSVPGDLCPVGQGPPKASLKMFRCEMDEPFAKTMLFAHAETLEEVEIQNIRPDATTIRLLVRGMPRLWSLGSSMYHEMEALAECATLRKLQIQMDSDLVEAAGAVSLLRRAGGQLRSVYLDYRFDSDLPDVSPLLIDALVSSRRPLLERVKVVCVDQKPLLRSLHMLPALHELDLGEVDLKRNRERKMLLTITPDTAPALSALKMAPCFKCTHAWLHGGAVRLLAANPALHIHLSLQSYSFSCRNRDCGAPEGCHQEVRWRVGEWISVSSHDLDTCPSPQDHGNFELEDPWSNYGWGPRTWIHMK